MPATSASTPTPTRSGWQQLVAARALMPAVRALRDCPLSELSEMADIAHACHRIIADSDGAWPAEEERAAKLFGEYVKQSSVRGDLANRLYEALAAKRRERASVPVSASPSGMCPVLVGGAGPGGIGAFGSVLRLRVAVTPWLARTALRTVSGAGSSEAYEAFWRANYLFDAAIVSAAPVGVNDAERARVRRWLNYLGRVADVVETSSVDGPSLALGVLIALASAVLEEPVPSGLAVTGALAMDGRIEDVGFMPQKWQGACDKGLTRIVIPAPLAKPTSGGEPAAVVEVWPDEPTVSIVSTAIGALQTVFGEGVSDRIWERVARGTSMLVARDLSDGTGQVPTIPGQGKVKDAAVFISIVASNDPYGSQRVLRRAAAVEVEEGAALTCENQLQPWRMYAIHTQDFAERATSVKHIVNARRMDTNRCRLVPLDGVDDPTDFQQLLRALKAALHVIKRETEGAPVRYYLNATSGTQQMQIILHLLAREGIPMPLEMLQVRPSEKLKEGEERIRIVSLPEDL